VAGKDGNDSFREFDHTGDLGIEVRASTRAQLFGRAVTALARLMVERGGVAPVERREIEVRGGGDADLMHDLLAAALNLFLADEFIWCDTMVGERDGGLVATLAGEPFDPQRHRLITEIKAVTYHQLTVEHAPGGDWRAIVIFDI
jgi:protein archease